MAAADLERVRSEMQCVCLRCSILSGVSSRLTFAALHCYTFHCALNKARLRAAPGRNCSALFGYCSLPEHRNQSATGVSLRIAFANSNSHHGMQASLTSSAQCARQAVAGVAGIAPRTAAAAPVSPPLLPRSRPPTVRAAGPARRTACAPASAARPSIVCTASASTSYADAPATPVAGQPGQFPAVSGVYAVLDAAGTLQYIGLSRKIAVSVATHLDALPELVHSVKVLELPDAGKEELTEAWRLWVQEAGEQLIHHTARRCDTASRPCSMLRHSPLLR